MTRYSIEYKDRIFLKGYGILSFAENISKNIGKNISKNVSGKYIQKPFDHAKQFATDAYKTTSKRGIQNIAEVTGGLVGDNIAGKIT